MWHLSSHGHVCVKLSFSFYKWNHRSPSTPAPASWLSGCRPHLHLCFFVPPALPRLLPHLPPQGHFLVPRGMLTAVPLVHALASPGLKVGRPLSGLPGCRWVFVASAN